MDLFKQASSLAEKKVEKSTVRRKSSSKGVVIRRDGKTVKDSVKRSEPKELKIKRRDLPNCPDVIVDRKVDRKKLDGNTVDNWLDYNSRRKALGKYVYNEREMLLRVLRDAYKVAYEELKWLSFEAMLSLLDEVKAEEARRLESLKKQREEDKKRYGTFMKSFKIVSDVTSVINSEHYKLAATEEENKNVHGVHPLTPEQRAERKRVQAAEWAVRSAIIKQKIEERKLEEYACKDLSLDEIKKVEAGNVEKAKTLDAIKAEKEKARKLEEIKNRGPRKMTKPVRETDKNGFLEDLNK